MKAMVTAAVIMLFAAATALSAGEPAEKKERKVVVTGQKSRGAWLGIGLGDYSSKSSDDKKENAKEGAIIDEVVDDSPADSVGLKEDDVIVEINGKAVKGAEDVVTRIGAMKPGEKAAIVVLRDGTKKTYTAVLAPRPAMDDRIGMRMPRSHMGIPRVHPPIAPMVHIERRTGVEGMKLMELRDQLGKYFEAPDGKALLVTEVKKNSNARKAGIEAGDVITKIGSNDIEDFSDLHKALKDAKEGTSVDVELIRKGAHKTVKLEVSEKQDDEMGMMMNFEGGFPHHQDFQFDFDNFNINREELRDMMRDLKPELEKIKPELDKIKKEIRIRMHGDRVSEPRVPQPAPAPGTEL